MYHEQGARMGQNDAGLVTADIVVIKKNTLVLYD